LRFFHFRSFLVQSPSRVFEAGSACGSLRGEALTRDASEKGSVPVFAAAPPGKSLFLNLGHFFPKYAA
jgi:hypothetical protein